MDPHDTPRPTRRLPHTALKLADVELDPVVPGVWRVLDRTADEDAALLGMVIEAGRDYQVIFTIVLGSRFTFTSLKDARAAFVQQPGDSSMR